MLVVAITVAYANAIDLPSIDIPLKDKQDHLAKSLNLEKNHK